MTKQAIVSENDQLKIEAPGCIVHIKSIGPEATLISVIADGDRYAGEPNWLVTSVKHDDLIVGIEVKAQKKA